MDKKIFHNDLKTAILFALAFVQLAAVISIWQTDIHLLLKLLTIIIYGLLLLKFFTKRHLITFAGFAIMMLGLNYIWADQNIVNLWKVTATVVVLLQLTTLGEDKHASEAE